MTQSNSIMADIQTLLSAIGAPEDIIPTATNRIAYWINSAANSRDVLHEIETHLGIKHTWRSH